MEGSVVELEANDGKEENGKEDEQSDLYVWRHRAQDRLEYYLQAYDKIVRR